MKYELDELTPEERHAFASLLNEKSPPPYVEERLVERLKGTGFIRGRSTWIRRYWQLAAACAIAIFLLALGAVAGARWGTNKQTDSPGFILIVRASSPELEAKTATEELERVKEYSAWARDLGKRGMLLGGEKLKDDGRILSQPPGANTIAESSSKPVEGAIAGYFLLPAIDLEKAEAIARTCPHLKHGGTVELRQIERF